MKRDTSKVASDSNVHCVQVIDDKTIEVYTDQSTTSYKLVSDQYIPSRTAEHRTPSDDVVCHTMTDIEQLPSQYDFLEPFLYNMALVASLFMFFIAFRIFIYPFFRKV